MPNWKKVVVSGSNAHLSEVTSSDGIKTSTINASGTITANAFSGDGSSLSGVSNFSISNASESRFVLTNGDGTAGEATSNMSEGGSFIHISKDFLGSSTNGFRYYAGDSDGPGPSQAAVFGYSTTAAFGGYIQLKDVHNFTGVQLSGATNNSWIYSGSFGLGTTSPDTKLEVRSYNREGIGQFQVLGIGSGDSGSAFMTIRAQSTRDAGIFFKSSNTITTEMIFDKSEEHFKIGSGSNYTIFDRESGDITASNNISASGNVIADEFHGDGSNLTGVTAGSVTFGNVTGKPTLISGSAQIATNISGSFTAASSSISSRLTTAETELSLTLLSGSAQVKALLPSGTISGSGQLPSGTVSGSSQILTSASDITIDTEGDIVLDANGSEIILKDGGTSFGKFKRDTSNFIIKAETADKDIVFKGVDDSTTIEAMRLDMSEGGNAVLGGNISGSLTSTGSFGRVEATKLKGDGSEITGLTAAAIQTYSSAGDNRVITSVNGTSVQGESGLTFDGSALEVNGTITSTGNITTMGNVIAENYIVSSSVTHMTQSFSSGSTIFGDGSADTHQFTGSLLVSGSITPGGDAVFNLGAPTKRFANIYSADFHLSNENTQGNDIDGTNGNWTIQEGEEDLYLLNNKNGKKYKFKLEEIK